MRSDPERGSVPESPPSRLFVHEPGWSTGIKQTSTKEFCYMRAPGQDYYHRLLPGELYLHAGDERLCMACAVRRGLIAHESQPLRESRRPLPVEEPRPFSRDDVLDLAD